MGKVFYFREVTVSKNILGKSFSDFLRTVSCIADDVVVSIGLLGLCLAQIGFDEILSREGLSALHN